MSDGSKPGTVVGVLWGPDGFPRCMTVTRLSAGALKADGSWGPLQASLNPYDPSSERYDLRESHSPLANVHRAVKRAVKALKGPTVAKLGMESHSIRYLGTASFPRSL